MRRRALVFVAVLLACAGCDHATKQIAQDTLTRSHAFSLADVTVRLELAHNVGAFLSLGAGLSAGARNLFLLGLAPLALALVCWSVLRRGPSSGWSLVALGLLAGGGLANWLDRLLHDGAVTDFIRVSLGPLHTGIFNLADVWIVTGAVLLLATGWRSAASGRHSP
jgi:signal peptidase II